MEKELLCTGGCGMTQSECDAHERQWPERSRYLHMDRRYAHAEALRLDALLPYRFTFDANSAHAASNGKLMHTYYPGGLSLYYVTSRGDVLCAACADRAESESDDPPTAAQENAESVLYCDDCGARIDASCGNDMAEELAAQSDAEANAKGGEV